MDKSILRQLAISHSLFSPTTLAAAFQCLQFVQADPIRSPARAQDLILRHRVTNYHNGDLERHYTELGIEEAFLYAHGFMTPDVWELLLFRDAKLPKFDKQVLEFVEAQGQVDPKSLLDQFGKKTERNWWGGNSQATKMALERLHYYGYIKIAGRKNGQRIYAPFTPSTLNLSEAERINRLIMVVVNILAPVTRKRLSGSLFRIRRHLPQTNAVLKQLIADGELVAEKIAGLEYIWPATGLQKAEVPETVKFLAPFDPVVWDRERFEHLWGWQYRFEAYVPQAKRVRGYYAMPLLWRDQVIGWANVDKAGGVELGFVEGRPNEKQFELELEAEITRMREFLA